MIGATQINGNFRPLHDWVVLRRLKDAKDNVRGGLLLPENVKLHEYGRCEVVSVGPGIRPCPGGVFYGPLIPCELKPKQHVYIQKFVEGEVKFELNGEEVFLVRERHLNVTIDN